MPSLVAVCVCLIACGETSGDSVDTSQSGPERAEAGPTKTRGDSGESPEPRDGPTSLGPDDAECSARGALRVTVVTPYDTGTCGLDVRVRGGETEQRLSETPDPSAGCVYAGAVETTGTYSFTVNGDRLEPVETSPIEIEADCGPPRQIEITARGRCYEVAGRRFDAENRCFGIAEPLEGICLREQVPCCTTGTGSSGCLIAPDGAVYVAFIPNTTRLESMEWTGEGADGLPRFDPVTPDCVDALSAIGGFDAGALPTCR